MYAEPRSVTSEDLETPDGMDLDEPAKVQLAVKACLPGERTVMVSTPLGTLLSDFMIKLRNQMQIQMDQPLWVSFGCKTLKMEVTLAENGLRELDTVYLSVPLAGGMQGAPGAPGAHISSLIPLSWGGAK